MEDSEITFVHELVTGYEAGVKTDPNVNIIDNHIIFFIETLPLLLNSNYSTSNAFSDPTYEDTTGLFSELSA
jgi:hypothetical protein